MIITPSPEIVRLVVMQGTSSTSGITHDYDIRQLFNNRDKYKYELVFYPYSSTNVHDPVPVYCNDYYFAVGSTSVSLVFAPVVTGQSKKYVTLLENKTVSFTDYTGTYSDQLFIDGRSEEIFKREMANDGLSSNTYTVGYNSDRLVLDFSNDSDISLNGSYLFMVTAVGDTTGNAEQVLCTKVPSKSFLAKSTPSLFKVEQDSENTNIYYIACKTSGYTTTLNVTKIIDTTNNSGVSIYQE